MQNLRVVGVYRLVLGVTAAAAIVVQYVNRAGTVNFNPVNFFSFFTIESNILAAAVFIVTGVLLFMRGTPLKGLDVLRGAATVYMVTTGLVYTLLLSGNEVALQTTLPWVNTVLHYIMPVALLLDWVLDPPLKRLSYRQMLGWMAFPIVYLVYSLERGPWVNWYPYPFIDPRLHSYGIVAAYCAGIAVAIGVICLGVRLLGNMRLPNETAPVKTKT